MPSTHEAVPAPLLHHPSRAHSAASGGQTIEPAAANSGFFAAINAGLVPRADVGPIARRAAGGEVQSDAGAHVALAATSSGSALPATLQRKFEDSLGADLSNVRIHDGAESATAAASVSARAYTTGQDVHFAAGQYNPSTTEGEHLLAHEVAHTVQQSGSTPRTQFKLEVSTPGDHHEVEADVAADAMVNGRPASVSAGGAQLGRVVMRTPSSDLGEAAERGETVERGALQLAPPRIAGVSNVQDVAQAQRIYDEIEHDQPHLEEGNRVGNSVLTGMLGGENPLVTQAQIQANENVRTALSTFMASAGEQSRELGDYQRQYQQCIIDFARIHSMIEQFQSTHPGVLGATNASEAALMGGAVVQAASGLSPAAMGERTRTAAARGTGHLDSSLGRFDDSRVELDAVSREIVTHQRQASSQSQQVLAAIDELAAGPTTHVAAGAEASGDLAGVRAQCESVKTWVRRATGLASSRASTFMTGTLGASSAVASAVTDHVGDVTDFFADAAYTQQIQTLETAVARAGSRADGHARDALVRLVRSAMESWHANLRALLDAFERMQLMRNRMRTATDMTSRVADTSGHGDVAVVARLTGECDVFLAQARMTIGLGEAEQAAAAGATADRTGAGAMSYYAAVQTYSMGQITYQAQERQVTIAGGYGARSSEGAGGVNPTVTSSLRELRGFEQIVSAFHRQLATGMGLGDVSTSAGSMATDPAMQSATGDPTVAAH